MLLRLQGRELRGLRPAARVQPEEVWQEVQHLELQERIEHPQVRLGEVRPEDVRQVELPERTGQAHPAS